MKKRKEKHKTNGFPIKIQQLMNINIRQLLNEKYKTELNKYGDNICKCTLPIRIWGKSGIARNIIKNTLNNTM